MLPTLNIILYTDYPTWFNENPLDPEGGLTDLEEFIKEKTKQFVNVNFQLVSRHGADVITGEELHGLEMITDQLLSNADELWVFGRRMMKTNGEPHNELEPSEIEILERHMGPERRIGIFVTGDHSESPEGLACHQSPHDTYLSLGRALGIGIPIAGLLRDWVGPPTNCVELPFDKRDNFNTQEGLPPEALDESDFESDSIPQTIILDPDEPHFLFTYENSNGELRLIEKLPDHIHEGRVLGPEDLDNWPDDLPKPVVAARGRDKRFPTENKVSNLVVVFDGDEVDKSRIVVDSSFHHYLNYNLRHIPSRNAVSKQPEPDSPLDQIAHFFGNLALWLAPKAIRDKIKFDIMLSLARHTSVVETLNLSDARLGRVARHVLRTTIGPGRLQWLFGKSSLEAKNTIDEFFSLLFLSDEESFRFREILTADQFLGTTVRICDHFLTKHQIADVTRITRHEEVWLPLWTSLFTGLQVAQAEFSRQAPESATSNQLDTNNDLKGEEEMPFRCNHHWRSFVNEQPDGVLRVLHMTGATFTGEHDKGMPHNPSFTGDCQDTPIHHIHIETDEDFEYNGRIFDAGNQRFVVGTRNGFTKDKNGNRKKLTDDEVWVGVKTSE